MGVMGIANRSAEAHGWQIAADCEPVDSASSARKTPPAQHN
jgi:hypothetical protein